MAYNYTSYDYDALVAEITRLVSNKGTWKDAYQSSTGQVLIQLVAALTDQLHYSLERRTQEAYLPTAKLITSVRSLANLLGYRAGRKVSANGTLSLSLVDNNNLPIQNTDTITIPKYSKLTFNNENFVNTEVITLLSTQVYPYTFSIKEGAVISSTYDPTDISSTLYQNSYILITDYESIEETSFDISTTTQTFTDVDTRIGNAPAIESIVFAGTTDKVYDIRFTNYGLQLVFGDGINGEKPVGILTVNYVNSSGTDVEVVSTGNSFLFDNYKTELEDASLTKYKYTLTNTTNIDGGIAEETISKIKLKAPNFVRTSNRAVTKDDYVYWSKQSGIGNIVDAIAYGEEELGITTVNANNVYLTYLTSNGAKLNSTETSDLNTYLIAYKPVTTQMVYEAAEVIPLQILLKVERSSDLTASNSEVFDYLKSELTNQFTFDETSLSEDRYHSELIDYFHNLTMTKQGVAKTVANYVTIDMKALKAFTVPYLVSTDTIATITYGVDTDVYEINIDDVPYVYTSGVAETSNIVTTQLAKYANFHLSTFATGDIATDKITITQTGVDDVQNEILYSEELNNAVWTATSVTVTANSTKAPDGITSGDTLADNSGSVTGDITQSITITDDSTSWTISLYVLKETAPADYPAIKFDMTGGTNVTTTVGLDHENGAGSSFAGSSPTIVVTDVDDYWRFSITLANNGTGNTTLAYTIYPSYDNAYPLVAADVTLTGSIFVWGAQVENNYTPRKYIRTKEKIYDLTLGTTAIQNHVIYSNELDNAAWTAIGTSVVTANSVISPDGATTAETLTDDDAASNEYIEQALTVPDSSLTYILSAYLKQGTAALSVIQFEYTGGTTVDCLGDIDWSTNTITVGGSSINATMTSVGNGWYRCSIECTNNLTGNTTGTVRVYPAGQTTTAIGTIYAWGVQVEKASSIGTFVHTTSKEIHLYDQGYSISNRGTTTTLNNRIDITVNIPSPLLNNSGSVQQFEPLNIQLIKDNGTILDTDDGVGVIYNGTINYITGTTIIPIPPEGEYYLRYLQNLDGKFVANEKQAFTYLSAKTSYSTITEELSTITLV